MLRAEGNHPRWFVHAPSDVPNVKVLSSVHDEELAEAVHEARGVLFFVSPLAAAVVVHCAPVDLHDRQLAGIAPEGNGGSVGVMVNAVK